MTLHAIIYSSQATTRFRVLSLLLLFATILSAQENDEFGVWSEIGVEKAITRKWDVGMDLEFRVQDRTRFSAGVSTSYKFNKYLKLGIGYNFLYSYRPNKFKDKSEGEVGSDNWTIGYNHTPSYWYPRHRFSAEATGSIKLWRWLKVSLRERYQLTYCKARSVTKYKHRTAYQMVYDFDEDWNPITYIDPLPPTVTSETEVKPSFTDQVLRSRIKLEFDKKRNPFSPFVSAEFHNSVSVGDKMLLQKIRTAVGSSYKFLKHHEISLAYIITFNMYDIEDNEVIRQHDRIHAINASYKYSF